MGPMPRIWDDTVAGHKDKLRRSVVDAAVALVAERGRTDVSMSAIAERAGIGRATLYNYFPDVDHILAAYVVGQFDQQHAALDQRLADLDDPLVRLRASLELVVTYFASAAHRTASPIGLDTFGPETQALVDVATRGFRDRLAVMIRDAIDAGLLRDDLDPEFAADALNHLLAAARMMAIDGTRTPHEVVDLVYGLFVGGAGTAKGRRRRPRPAAVTAD